MNKKRALRALFLLKPLKMTIRNRVFFAAKAVIIHLFLCALIAALIGLLVFELWFPYPYGELVGGRRLFLIIIGVDVVCGPLLTLILFNPCKKPRELRLDFTLIAGIQLLALGYGVFSLAESRPVYTVFEVDRFFVVTAADIKKEDLNPDRGGLQKLPWTGPVVIGIRESKDNQEQMKSLELSMAGITPAMRPDWWQSFELSRQKILEKAHPVDLLRKNHPEKSKLINDAVYFSGQDEKSLLWLPITSMFTKDWVVFIDAVNGRLLSFASVDGF